MTVVTTSVPPDPSLRRLSRLSDDSALIALLGRIGSDLGWWRDGLGWRRSFGRQFADESRYCTLLFECDKPVQELCVVEAFDRRPDDDGHGAVYLLDPYLGWLRVSRFPSDRELATLPALLDSLDGVRVLRYRPEKRCTLSVQDVGGKLRFAKVFADGRGERIHAGGEMLWQASRAGELAFDVAVPIAWDANRRTLWQSAVSGRPVVSTLHSWRGPALAHRMGVACGSLAASGLQPEDSFDGMAQWKRTARYADELAQWLPERAADVREAVDRLREGHLAFRGKPARPIHGAPHAHQWLATGRKLGLVDFDRFCAGDPELDVATFLAETDFETSGRVPIRQINARFVEGYESVQGPLERPLIDLYRNHKYLAKSLKAARSVHPSSLVKARRHLDLALDGLRTSQP